MQGLNRDFQGVVRFLRLLVMMMVFVFVVLVDEFHNVAMGGRGRQHRKTEGPQ